MAANARFKLKQTPTDVWSIRERLALACSVMRSGDQNWVSVSRAIKPFGEPSRPPDWFSQKNCALQYSDLLEKVETPKRKRSERGETETPGDQIVRKLTIERIEELKRLVQEEQQKYKKLKQDVELIRSGQLDDKIKDVWEEMQAQKKAAETAAIAATAKAAEEAQARLQAQARIPGKPVAVPKKALPGLKLKMGLTPDMDDSMQEEAVPDTDIVKVEPDSSVQSTSAAATATATQSQLEVKPKGTPPSSPLLSSLLQNKHQLQQALAAQQQQQLQQMQKLKWEQEQQQLKQLNLPGMGEQKPTIQIVQVKKEAVDVDVVSVSDAASTSTGTVTKAEPKTETQTDVQPSAVAGVSSSGSTAVTVAVTAADTAAGMDCANASTAAVAVAASTVSPTTSSLPAVSVSRSGVSCVTTTAATAAAVELTTTATTTTTTSATSVTAAATTTSTTTPTAQAKPEVQSVHSAESTEDQEDDDEISFKKFPATSSEQGDPQTDVQDQASEKCETPDSLAAGHGKAPLLPVEDDEPASPTSSIVSNETDSGSTKGKVLRRGRGKGRPGRRSTRVTRGRVPDEEKKDVETSSKQSEMDSSDDETLPLDEQIALATPKRALSISESVPNSPASMSQSSDTEDEKAYKVWKKSIMLVWRAAANHKYANVFLHKVTDEIAPGYTSIVYRPMDLMTIKKMIESGSMRTTAEFQRDMMLMFTNAIMYNNSDHDVYHMAVEMYDDVMMHIEQYVNTQMMVQSEAKILRTSRRSDATSDKEEDPKKRKTATVEHEGGKSKKRKV